jgi:hypothetical protein
LKAAAAQRSAELLAEFEQQLASIYHFDQDEVWRQAHEAAVRACAEAEKAILGRCAELGIPACFTPGINIG